MASQGHRPPSLTPSVKAAFMRQGLCFRCGVKGHIAKVCQGHTTQFSMNKAVQTTSLTADGRYCVQNGLCFRCKQPGHKQDDLKSCPEGHRAIFPFLKLAREVRNLVYEHYDLDWNKSVEFVRKEVNNHYFNIRQGRVPAVPPPLPCFKRTPKILLLNRQITSEALEGLRKKPLIFNLHDHDDYYVFGGSLYHPNHFFGAIGLNTLRCVPQIEFHFNREILLAASDIVRRFCIIISRTNIVHIPLRIVIGDGNSIYNYTNGAWHYVMFSHYLDEMFLRREKYHSDIYVVEVEALDRIQSASDTSLCCVDGMPPPGEKMGYMLSTFFHRFQPAYPFKTSRTLTIEGPGLSHIFGHGVSWACSPVVRPFPPMPHLFGPWTTTDNRLAPADYDHGAM